MLKQWIMMALSIGFVFNYGACVQQDPSVVTAPCYPDSFNQGSCTMKCTVTTNGTLQSWSWQYFTTYENDNIAIYDGVELTSQNDTYTISLTLDDYNAGTYKCLFYFVDAPSSSFNAKIKISEATNGADLYQDCNVAHDCNALHATCSNDNYYYYTPTCMCVGEYDIIYNSESDTLACLKLQPEGGHCYSYSECNWPTQSYACINSHCHCTGNMTQVNIDGTETEMCIKPVYLDNVCYYDEQCELADEHSYCYADRHYYDYKYCDCEKRYSVGYAPYGYNYCYYTGLEGWQIACIVLGTLFGLAIIGSAIFYFLKKSH